MKQTVLLEMEETVIGSGKFNLRVKANVANPFEAIDICLRGAAYFNKQTEAAVMQADGQGGPGIEIAKQ